MLKQLLLFLKELNLRLSSMNHPWIYDRVSKDWLEKLSIRGDTNDY
jgi:hypothetical protein